MAKSPKDTKGPVVKTGPTKGKNRTRTSEGKWRQKRSDAGKPRGKKSDKSGCFLTTAACKLNGLPDNCLELSTLREFRDTYLLSTIHGKELVEEYYTIAPDLVPLLDNEVVADEVWQKITASVLHIEASEFDEAVKCYKEMVLHLQHCAL